MLKSKSWAHENGLKLHQESSGWTLGKYFSLSRWLLSGLAVGGSVRSRELSMVIFMGPFLLETLCVLYLCAGITMAPRRRAGSDVQEQTDSICHVCDNSKGRKLRRLICVDSGPNPCAKTFLWREHTLFKTCMFWAVFALKRQSTMGGSLSWRLFCQGLLEGRSRTLSQRRRTDCAISQEFTILHFSPPALPSHFCCSSRGNKAQPGEVFISARGSLKVSPRPWPCAFHIVSSADLLWLWEGYRKGLVRVAHCCYFSWGKKIPKKMIWKVKFRKFTWQSF